MFEEADLIHSYTRADALRDGVLVDVSAVAREAGFRYPVALTRAAWERCVTVPPGVPCQDEPGRLWDVLLDAALRDCPGFCRARGAVCAARPRRQPRAPPGAPEGSLGPGDRGEPFLNLRRHTGPSFCC
jgi:hypothetical protein